MKTTSLDRKRKAGREEMIRRRIAVAKRIGFLVLIAVIVVAATSVAVFVQRLSTSCVYSAEPLALDLSVVSDTNQTPVVGAHVTATNTVLLCNGFAPATPRQTVAFVTNSSEWHYLPTAAGDSGYTFTVSYAGRTYSFSTTLYVEAATCVTLFAPSGRTNVTFASLQSTCPPRSLITTTSSSTNSTYSSSSYSSGMGAPSISTVALVF